METGARAMTAADDTSLRSEARLQGETLKSETRKPGLLARWLRRRRANRHNIDHAVWDLRERYGAAAANIARASSRSPVGFERKRFWRKVAKRLERL